MNQAAAGMRALLLLGWCGVGRTTPVHVVVLNHCWVVPTAVDYYDVSTQQLTTAMCLWVSRP